jgi:seryl-tRNA synthetase
MEILVTAILSGKEHIEKNLKILQPELTRYVGIAEQIKEKSKERKTLLAEKKATPIIQIPKHRELSRRIAELTEELEELRSEKVLLLQSLQYAEDTDIDVIRKDISTMEAGLKRLEQQEQKYAAELENALKEYAELKEQAAEFDADELMNECLAIRPGKERSAVARVQSAYGDRYQLLMMDDAKRDVAQLLYEGAGRQSIRAQLRQHGRTRYVQQPQRKKHREDWER